MKRFWPWRTTNAVVNDSSPIQGIGSNPIAPDPSEIQKLAIVFYDSDLNIVGQEHAVYELHFYNGVSLEWRLSHGKPDDVARFSVAPYTFDWAPEEWAKFPLNIAGDFIKSLAHDPETQCGFAFQWINTDWPGRYRMFLATHRGSLNECEKVLTWLTHVFSFADKNWSRATWTIKIEQSDADPRTPFLWSQIKRDFELRLDETVEFSDEQFKLLRIVHCYFMPFYFRKVKLPGHRSNEVQWRFEVLSASHHERLGACLHLRDWLQDKVAPEEIPFLLGEAP